MTAHRAIHAGFKTLGIEDDEARRAIYARATGKTRLRDMTDRDRQAVVEELRRLGFKPLSKAAPTPKAKRPDVRFCHVLWRLLVEAGEAKVPGRKGLNAFVRSRFGAAWGSVPIDIDAMQDGAEIHDVIEALKAWCDRAGVERSE